MDGYRDLYAQPRVKWPSGRLDIFNGIDANGAMQTLQHASITIRNLDPALKERLRIRAAQRGHSMEAEARHILQIALSPEEKLPTRHLYAQVRARFAPLGGVDLELPPRERACEPPCFDRC